LESLTVVAQVAKSRIATCLGSRSPLPLTLFRSQLDFQMVASFHLENLISTLFDRYPQDQPTLQVLQVDYVPRRSLKSQAFDYIQVRYAPRRSIKLLSLQLLRNWDLETPYR
jgi:hypothetical protein